MFISPDPDEFYDAVFFIDPVTKTVDDSLVMSLCKDPLNADRYSKFLQPRPLHSSPSVDDETNFALCMPRSVQSLSDRTLFNESLADFIKSSIRSSPEKADSPISLDGVSHSPEPSNSPDSSNS
jgi:hypothetical protein